MPAQRLRRNRRLTLFSQFVHNGIDLIDAEHSPEDYPYVWVANALHTDTDIRDILSEATAAVEGRLDLVDQSHLFTREYSVLIFYQHTRDFLRFAERVCEQAQLHRRSDYHSQIIPYTLTDLVADAKELSNQGSLASEDMLHNGFAYSPKPFSSKTASSSLTRKSSI